MNVITRTIEYKTHGDMFRIVPLSDIHLGSAECDEKLLKATIADIAEDPKAYTVLMGDMCEWINRKDPRYDAGRIAPWLYGIGDIAKRQRQKLTEVLEPVGSSLLAMLEGNHERTIYEHDERDVYTTVAEALGDGEHKLCLGPSGFLRVVFRSEHGHNFMVTLFLTHGWWGGRLMGAGALNLERVIGWVEADMVLAGHDHKRRALSVQKLKATPYNVRQITCWGCSCGSFLDYPDYAQRKGYRPQPPGVIEILIQPWQRQVRVLQ